MFELNEKVAIVKVDPSVRAKLEEGAGAIWEDEAAVVDRHFVCSRKPDDLPAFCRAILQVLS